LSIAYKGPQRIDAKSHHDSKRERMKKLIGPFVITSSKVALPEKYRRWAWTKYTSPGRYRTFQLCDHLRA
jgi:hypothetical protein